MDSYTFVAETRVQVARPIVLVPGFRQVAIHVLQIVSEVYSLQVDFRGLVPLELAQRINPVVFQGIAGIAAPARIRIAPAAHVQKVDGFKYVPGTLRKFHSVIRAQIKFPVVDFRAVAFGIAHVRPDKALEKTARLFHVRIALEPFAGNVRLALHMH